MRLKSRLKKLLEQTTRTRIYRRLPRGVDFAVDIQAALPGYEPRVIVDVGANTGQSARGFLNRFPAAQIYCFEPVATTQRRLRERFADEPRVECLEFALGAEPGEGEMVLAGPSEQHYLRSPEAADSDGPATQSVSIDTLDRFCAQRAIDRIHYLKIDTEGSDLDVLRGSVHCLTGQTVDLVQVEAGMNPGNTTHVPLEELKAFLEARDYYLFALYEQVNEWPTRAPHLRRVNPVFISRRLSEAFRDSTPA
ncbi:FkbM family methyltransferase [Mangrovimicrobium sediminis]|uniref:FkbM family methyltransferase n=1 Tax=Mangrovimicrobium sediminis TaxID=2562682 RepID=A0A4Z0LYK5_9GAMM|nr:FkbM family methyltransferase [Haliea sp. SAOS-164]TGD72320.1 FkbM family methyltransferase [Haliea sp. SAOS-164]